MWLAIIILVMLFANLIANSNAEAASRERRHKFMTEQGYVKKNGVYVKASKAKLKRHSRS